MNLTVPDLSDMLPRFTSTISPMATCRGPSAIAHNRAQHALLLFRLSRQSASGRFSLRLRESIRTARGVERHCRSGHICRNFNPPGTTAVSGARRNRGDALYSFSNHSLCVTFAGRVATTTQAGIIVLHDGIGKLQSAFCSGLDASAANSSEDGDMSRMPRALSHLLPLLNRCITDDLGT